MALSRDEVLHIATLADLSLTPEEVEHMQQDLGAILAHMAQLEAVDTRDVPPTAHLAVTAMPLREDTVVPSLGQAGALAAAPQSNLGGFAVPRFVED
jgi:aspartyl-tRNA(Asn)/glutamyl-tRNA(Gln) amidotransferase subunit C